MIEAEKVTKPIKRPQALSAALLYRTCDPAQLASETTTDLEDLTEIIGLDRAMEALRFGMGIQRQGYNLYVLGPAGIGKHSVVASFLKEKAAKESTPSDWCYVNNFDEPQKPRALELPAEMGFGLRQDMRKLVEELRSAIPAAFETEEYRTRKRVIEEEFKDRQEKTVQKLRQKAWAEGFILVQSPLGPIFAPMKDGEPISPDEFQKLSEEDRKINEEKIEKLQQDLQEIVRQFPQWERDGREKVKKLNREVTMFAVGHLIEDLRRKYSALPDVVNYLDAVQQDVLANAQHFVNPPESPLAGLLGASHLRPAEEMTFFRRYQVNVIVNYRSTEGAPVIYEDHPTYQNLVGRVEHLATLGALVTDFNLIRGGALHRANGGYLILDGAKVLMQPYAWEGLKRILRSGQVRIDSLGRPSA